MKTVNPPIELHDDDPFPIPGRHFRKKMSDVPTTWYNSFWNSSGKLDPTSMISDYVRRNRRWLEADKPDLVWDNR